MIGTTTKVRYIKTDIYATRVVVREEKGDNSQMRVYATSSYVYLHE